MNCKLLSEVNYFEDIVRIDRDNIVHHEDGAYHITGGPKKLSDDKFVQVEKLKAHGNESAKVEAWQRREVREADAERRKDHMEAQNAAEKERTVNPHPGPIGDRPSPADFDMDTENPTAPSMGGEASTMAGSTIPNYVGPFGSTVA